MCYRWPGGEVGCSPLMECFRNSFFLRTDGLWKVKWDEAWKDFQAHWWANLEDGLNCTKEQVLTIIVIERGQTHEPKCTSIHPSTIRLPSTILTIIMITIITLQILKALQGTMVMEIQPISSCSEAARSEGLCRRTISSKVGFVPNAASQLLDLIGTRYDVSKTKQWIDLIDFLVLFAAWATPPCSRGICVQF